MYTRAALAAVLATAFAMPLAAQSGDDGTATFGTTVVVPFGLAGDLYFLPPDTDRLPDFDRMVPVGRVFTNRLNVPAREFTGGFPGLSSRVEWFALDYNGHFWAETPGNYKFSLLSDDGSRLYIDDRLEIDNDGTHAPVLIACSVKLKRGIHKIRVSYFQGPRYSLALVLSIAPPGEKWRIFNTDELKPPSNTSDWNAEDLKALAELQKEPSRKPRKTSKEMAAEDAALERLKGPDPPHDFAFRSSVLQFPTGSGRPGTDLTVAYEVPLDNLRLRVDDRAETGTWRFLLLAVIEDKNGKIAGEMKLDVPFAVPAGQARTLSGRRFTFARNFHLPAGSYRIATGVLDRGSGKIGSETVQVDSDVDASGVRISSLVMVDHLQPGAATDDPDPLVFQGQRLVPMLSRKLSASEPRTVFFVAAADPKSAEKPKLQVRFLVNGAELANAIQAMPDPNAAGLIPVSFAAPARPGTCELRLTAMQGESRSTQSLVYEVDQ